MCTLICIKTLVSLTASTQFWWKHWFCQWHSSIMGQTMDFALETLLIFIRNSIQHALDEKARGGPNAIRMFIANWFLLNALEEEAQIPLQSLLISIGNSLGNVFEDDDHIPFESLLFLLQEEAHIWFQFWINSEMLWRIRNTFHYSPCWFLLQIQCNVCWRRKPGEAQHPLESSLISIRNWMQHALDDKARGSPNSIRILIVFF